MKKKYQTGSHHLKRVPFFNPRGDINVDIPDGDVEIGRKVFQVNCAGCHDLFHNKILGPRLHNVFGKTAGCQKDYKAYSLTLRSLRYQWSKQRLYYLIEDTDEAIGLYSSMTFGGMSDRYEKACLIEYLHWMRIHTSPLVKPQWINKPFE